VPERVPATEFVAIDIDPLLLDLARCGGVTTR
jgi:hypothetical protein